MTGRATIPMVTRWFQGPRTRVPDLLVLAPDGRRIIVEVVCNNTDYDAQNILLEAALPGVDRVIAITLDGRAAQELQNALEKAAGTTAKPDWQASVLILPAIQCMASKFDWASVLNATLVDTQPSSGSELF